MLESLSTDIVGTGAEGHDGGSLRVGDSVGEHMGGGVVGDGHAEHGLAGVVHEGRAVVVFLVVAAGIERGIDPAGVLEVEHVFRAGTETEGNAG